MLISQAFAASGTPTPMTADNAGETTAETAVPSTDAPIAAQSTQNMLIQQVGMILLLVVMFYFLLIRPQQKRFKEHKDMVDGLKKGDRVVTGGGLLGNIDTLVNDQEVIVDLGSGLKVTALRSMLQGKPEKPTETDKAKK